MFFGDIAGDPACILRPQHHFNFPSRDWRRCPCSRSSSALRSTTQDRSEVQRFDWPMHVRGTKQQVWTQVESDQAASESLSIVGKVRPDRQPNIVKHVTNRRTCRAGAMLVDYERKRFMLLHFVRS